MQKLMISFLVFFSLSSLALNAPDASKPGPYSVATGEYHNPAQVYSDVLNDRKTELWANFHYPQDLVNTAVKLPLIILLHGNHATCGFGSNPRYDNNCEYTSTGSCPQGYQVINNHKGYDYLAQHLASWGFMVVSINANRGITCGGGTNGDYGLVLARGRLVLKHLQQLYDWQQQDGQADNGGLSRADLQLMHQIDFNQVGLFGHSRGGEGVRAAYNFYRDANSSWPKKIPNLNIKAIFEIGSVDGQSNRILDATGITWNQLVPLCDGDVVDFQGRYPFDRMILNRSEPESAQKSLYEVWGANHNFFNTEWQKADNLYCPADIRIYDPEDSGSLKQQVVAKNAVTAFFKSHLGDMPDFTFNQNLNPLAQIPAEIESVTQVDRDFIASPSGQEYFSVDEFDKRTGINHSGLHNESNQIKYSHEYLNDDWSGSNRQQQPQRVGMILWDTYNQRPYFKAVFAQLQQGINSKPYTTLDIRLGRQHSYVNKLATTDFTVQMEDDNGTLSNAVAINVNGPGSQTTILKTVRIPLTAFSGFNAERLRAVIFNFDKTASGAIYLANIRLHKQIGLGGSSPTPQPQPRPGIQPHHPKKLSKTIIISAKHNQIKLHQPAKHSRLHAQQQPIEIRLTSDVAFDVLDSLPVLHIGKQTFKLSRYPNPSNLQEIAFILTPEEFKQLNKQAIPRLRYGKQWQFKSIQDSPK